MQSQARNVQTEERARAVEDGGEPSLRDAVVSCRSLTKRYGELAAVEEVTFTLRPGTVTGFLGPNGAGKTTTLRVLLGLAEPTAGEVFVFGRRYRDLDQPVRRVGAMLESGDFHPGRSGRDHLRALALAARLPLGRVEQVLELVELEAAAGRRVNTYSLGMRQRLGLAAALLGDPALLILDEPANGLDPAGIREMRDLMRSLSAAGVTVLLSSHILAEIQLICDHVTIISRGRRVAAGPVGEVLAGFDQHEWQVRVAEPERAAELLRALGLAVTAHPDHLVVAGMDEPELISRTLGEQGLWVRELVPLRPDLESVFLELTGTMPHPTVPRQMDGSVRPDDGPDDAVIELDARENREVGA
jgi:ABC-2 type transport system ATP-binding protein